MKYNFKFVLLIEFEFHYFNNLGKYHVQNYNF